LAETIFLDLCIKLFYWKDKEPFVPAFYSAIDRMEREMIFNNRRTFLLAIFRDLQNRSLIKIDYRAYFDNQIEIYKRVISETKLKNQQKYTDFDFSGNDLYILAKKLDKFDVMLINDPENDSLVKKSFFKSVKTNTVNAAEKEEGGITKVLKTKQVKIYPIINDSIHTVEGKIKEQVKQRKELYDIDNANLENFLDLKKYLNREELQTYIPLT